MKIAFGILGVLLILAIVYYFLPQGIKTTFRGIFGGTSTTQTVKSSPTPTPTPTPSVTVAPSAAATVRPSATPAGSGFLRSASPTPRATASATARASTQSASAKLPSTGIQNQPIEVTIIQILASALILMVGFRLSKHL